MTSPDATRLAAIKHRLAAVEPGFVLLAGDRGVSLVANMPDGQQTICTFAEPQHYDGFDFLTRAYDDVKFLVNLVDRSIIKVRDLQAQLPKPEKNFAAEAAMLCADPAFKTFLEARHGLERPLTDDRTANRLRSILAIGSRADLNTNPPAAERWKALKGSFESWKRNG